MFLLCPCLLLFGCPVFFLLLLSCPLPLLTLGGFPLCFCCPLFIVPQVRQFSSATRAATVLNTSPSSVLACLGGRTQQVKGFKFEWVGDPPEGRVKQPIIGTNLDTDEKRDFDSIKAAATALNISQSNISAVLGGRLEQSKRWTFERDGDYVKVESPKKKAKVVKKRSKKEEKESESSEESEKESKESSSSESEKETKKKSKNKKAKKEE
eukprot:Platyproteum_vivax@DN3044_c0_g1_i1.p1